MKEYYARIRKSDNKKQLLIDHLVKTSEIAEYFADSIGCQYFGKIMGLLHDAGKYSASWQEYLLQSLEGNVSFEKKDHATAGAQILFNFFSVDWIGYNKLDKKIKVT